MSKKVCSLVVHRDRDTTNRLHRVFQRKRKRQAPYSSREEEERAKQAKIALFKAIKDAKNRA